MDDQELVLQHLSTGDGAKVLDALDTPTLLLDGSGKVASANEAWRALCQQLLPGRTDGYLGRSYAAACRAFLVLKADRTTCLEGVRGVLDGTLPSFRFDYFVGVNDRPAWFRMTLTPLAEGGGVLVTHADVTGTKQAESSFKQLRCTRLSYHPEEATPRRFVSSTRTVRCAGFFRGGGLARTGRVGARSFRPCWAR